MCRYADTDADQMISLDKDQICTLRSYDSIFQFQTIHHDLKTVEDRQKLEIKDCIFQNIYYEIGSIVRLPDHEGPDGRDGLPWSLKISGTTFKDMSFCGSIISNDFPTFEGKVPVSKQEVFKNENYKRLKNQIKLKYQKRSKDGVDELDCKAEGTNCWTLFFEGNKVENLNRLKRDTP